MMMGAPRRPWNERYGMDAVAVPAPAPQALVKTKSAKLAKGAHPTPVARPAQTAQAAARAMPSREATVHFYSVHRDFGIQPTPAPIPPQFFGPTSDLSEPEGPQAIPAQTTGKGALAARARAEAETSAPD
jgi:hypothetical protein